MTTPRPQCPQEDRRGRRCHKPGKVDLISPFGYRTQTPVCGVHANVLVRAGWRIDYDCWPNR